MNSTMHEKRPTFFRGLLIALPLGIVGWFFIYQIVSWFFSGVAV